MNFKKIPSYPLVVCCLLLTIAACTPHRLKEKKDPFYKNDDYHYSIRFPEGTDYFIRPDRYYALYADLTVKDSLSRKGKASRLFRVVVMGADDGMSIEEYAEMQLGSQRQFSSEFTVTTSERMSLNNEECYNIEYTFTMGDMKNLHEIAYVFIKNGFVYMLFCRAEKGVFDRHREEIARCCSSFKIADAIADEPPQKHGFLQIPAIHLNWPFLSCTTVSLA